MFMLKNFCGVHYVNSHSIMYYMCWKYSVHLIFVVFDDHEKSWTTKISKLR